MNDEDQEDLLIHVSESEDSSAESDAYLDTGRVIPFVQQNDNTLNEEVKFCNKNRIEFFCSGTLLIVSSTSLLILLPLYCEAIDSVSDVYTLILFTSVVTTTIFLVLICLHRRTKLWKSSTYAESFKPPFNFSFLLQAGFAQGIGGVFVLFSSDSKKVLCHLQDPIKGITLVFALIFYFLFSKKLMGVQRIFCTTTMVVGLFVCLDYGLCDEFRCRGWERAHTEDDAGQWKHAVHFLAGSAYVVGLAMWTYHFSLIESGLASLQLAHLQSNTSNSDTSKIQQINTSVPPPTSSDTPKKPSALMLAAWIQFISGSVVLLCFWIDMLPFVGKASSWIHLANLTQHGLMCHVGITPKVGDETFDCGLLPILGWLFAAFLAVFSISASNVLILSQSAVLTVALMTCALPLGNIFWSFFRLPPTSKGALEWWPSLTAELICTFVGLPIVTAGLYLLCRSQLTENGPQREPCCTLRFHQKSSSNT